MTPGPTSAMCAYGMASTLWAGVAVSAPTADALDDALRPYLAYAAFCYGAWWLTRGSWH